VLLNDSARMARTLFVAGILLLLPGACTFMRSAPTDEDVRVAAAEVVRIRLDSFKPESPIRLAFTADDSSHSKRLREAWGDKGYLVYAEREQDSREDIVPFSTLKLDVSVSHCWSRARRSAIEPVSLSDGYFRLRRRLQADPRGETRDDAHGARYREPAGG